MTRVPRPLERLAARWRLRFGSPAARQTVAVAAGFVIASVGFGTIVAGASGNAQDFFGAFGSLFSAPQQLSAYPYSQPAQRVVRRAHGERTKVATRRHGQRATLVASEDGAPVRLGQASVCVRLCDGFTFPVGAFHGSSDVPAHEAACRSQCPGARTALYVLPTGSSAIEEAVDAHSGKAYSQKASGFHYTTFIDESCSCHPRAGNRIASLLHDFTLRRGDAVMTASGIKVFHGADRYPFRRGDFVRLAESRDIDKEVRATFRNIERASLTVVHPAVARFDRPITPSTTPLPAPRREARLDNPPT